jgi:hypothetical protein
MIEANYLAYLDYSIMIKNKAFNGQLLKDDYKEIFLSTQNEIIKRYPEVSHCSQHNFELMATLARIGLSQILLTQINYSPIIFINGQNYKGNYLNEQHLMETLCLSFQSYPSYCSKLPVFTSKENISN